MNITQHAALAALCVAATTAVFADEAPSVTLRVRTPVDGVNAEQVYQQIRNAAREVCAPLESKELTRESLHRQCIDQAVANAVAQAGSHALTNIHLSHLDNGQSHQ
jgi:UrcA family protein